MTTAGPHLDPAEFRPGSKYGIVLLIALVIAATIAYIAAEEIAGHWNAAAQVCLYAVPASALAILFFGPQRPARISLTALFLMAAAVHNLFNWLIGPMGTISYPGFGRSVVQSFEMAYALISAGLLAACLTYLAQFRGRGRNVRIPDWFVHPPLRLLLRRSRSGALVAIAGAIALFSYLGFVPGLEPRPLSARADLYSISSSATSLLFKLTGLAALCAPLVLLVSRRKSRWLIFFMAACVTAAAGNRDHLLFMIAAPIIVLVLRQGARTALVAGLSAAFMAALIFTGAYFKMGVRELSAGDAAWAASTTFGEYGDLAYMLARGTDQRLWGATYLADAIPAPVAWTLWKATHGLQGVTRNAAGGERFFGPQGSGGLRITIFGEAYINFGLPGVLLCGVLLGWTLFKVEGFLSHCLGGHPAAIYGAITITFLPIGALYLAATEALWPLALPALAVIPFLFRRPAHALPVGRSVAALGPPIARENA